MNFLVFPIISGLLFPIGSLLFKRSADLGVGPWRMTFVSNLGLAAIAPFFLLGSPPPGPDAVWWHPVVVGAVFFVGQIFCFLAVDRGDVTISTPIFGAKVIFVAFIASLLFGAHHVPPALWGAACITTLAVALLGAGRPASEHRGKFLFTVATAALAAFSYSCGDVLTQKWAASWGAARFTCYELFACALLSPLLMPFFHAPLREITPLSWRWLLGGSVVNAIQTCILYITIGRYGHATQVNVVYNVRSLVAVFLVWAVGHWFGNQERNVGPGTMALRLAGSLLLLSAIWLVAGGKTG